MALPARHSWRAGVAPRHGAPRVGLLARPCVSLASVEQPRRQLEVRIILNKTASPQEGEPPGMQSGRGTDSPDRTCVGRAASMASPSEGDRMNQADKARQFRALHEAPGAFVIGNAWDAGSARLLVGAGFVALATSSGATAGVLGR